MVDNRSAGFFGIGAFNFKSGDASSMANAMTDEKMGQGGEYFAQENAEDEGAEQNKEEFVDRSAELRGSLDSLALMNATNVVRAKKEKTDIKKKKSKKNLAHLVDDYEKFQG